MLGDFHVPPAEAYPIFDDLVRRYSEPHRHYHTLEHVAEMLRVVGRLSKYAADPIAVQLAAWFHDATYDPRSKGNETRSAELSVQLLGSAKVLPDVVSKVVELIRATEHGRSAEGSSEADAAVLLDADLAILAAEEKRYARYAADIRKEYGWVPEAEFRKGRTALLNNFLARPRIYHTPVMFEEGEESARRNLRAEIEHLQRTV